MIQGSKPAPAAAAAVAHWVGQHSRAPLKVQSYRRAFDSRWRHHRVVGLNILAGPSVGINTEKGARNKKEKYPYVHHK